MNKDKLKCVIEEAMLDEHKRRIARTGKMPNDQFVKLKRSLMSIHIMYYRLIEIGAPYFTYSIPTACIKFDKKSGTPLQFLFNPDFFESISEYTRSFVTAHEMLHIILQHGRRIGNCENPKLANIAADIVVNHMLVEKFGFYRNAINAWRELCWVDTIWPGENISKHKNLEYYYDLLLKNPPPDNVRTVDLHEFLADMTEEEVKEVISKMRFNVSPAEAKEIKNTIEECDDNEGGPASEGAAGIWTQLCIPKVKPKPKWESVISKWVQYKLKMTLCETEHWRRESRKCDPASTNLILPAHDFNYDFAKELHKIPVVFFLDTSGSCWGLKERFYQAVKSIPADKFEVKLFSFDTEVYPISIEDDKIAGGGGTCFAILESHVQKMVTTGELSKYPDAVWVMTDGYGTQVNPEKPENWHWFLSHNYTSCIPEQSKRFDLKDFE